MNKIIISTIALVIIATSFFGFKYYKNIFSANIIEDTKLYVKTNSTFNNVLEDISPKLKNIETFKQVANLKGFITPKPGMYLLTKGMNTNQIINKLKSGNQTPVKIKFNNQDNIEKLAGRIAQQLETDSISILKSMTDSTFLKANNFTKKSALGMYIPNQYECYWTDSADKFRNKMLYYYKKFWNEDRIKKAENLGLTKQEVITLASIVQKETAKKDERPVVAGLYLNRLKTEGWTLDADPTLIFALKEKNGHDKVYKRVLNKDKEIDSPYNTYKNAGLPPTLIAMPDISAIDAVLSPKKHDYFFMCASIEKMGYHDFAKTLAQHNRNAIKYQKWITDQGIKR